MSVMITMGMPDLLVMKNAFHLEIGVIQRKAQAALLSVEPFCIISQFAGTTLSGMVRLVVQEASDALDGGLVNVTLAKDVEMNLTKMKIGGRNLKITSVCMKDQRWKINLLPLLPVQTYF